MTEQEHGSVAMGDSSAPPCWWIDHGSHGQITQREDEATAAIDEGKKVVRYFSDRPAQEPVAWVSENTIALLGSMSKGASNVQISNTPFKRWTVPLYAAPQPAHGTSATERDTPAPADHVGAIEALRLVAAYDDLLQNYTGPISILTAGDNAKIDEAYDQMVAACRVALSRPAKEAVAWTQADAEREYAAFHEWWKKRGYDDFPDLYPLTCQNAMHAAWQEAAERAAPQPALSQPEVKALEWTMRQGNFDNQLCWDADGYWIMRDDSGYSLCDLELSEIPGCSPFLGKFDRLEDAMADAQERALATPTPKEESK